MPNDFTQLPKSITTKPDCSSIFQEKNSTSIDVVQSSIFQPAHSNLSDNYASSQENAASSKNNHVAHNNTLKENIKKQIPFKELYPDTEYDEEKQEEYLPINEVEGYENPEQAIEVDVQAYKRKGAYFLKCKKPTIAAVIYAHGEEDKKKEKIKMTDKSPAIWVVTPHGYVLNDPMRAIPMKKYFYAVITSEGIIPLTQHAAENVFRPGGFQLITGHKKIGYFANYTLSKFAELYKEEDVHAVNDREIFAKNVEFSSMTTMPYNAYCLRKKLAKYSSKTIFKQAKKDGHDNIICFFCRGSDRSYYIEEQKFLKNPFLVTWSEIEEIKKIDDVSNKFDTEAQDYYSYDSSDFDEFNEHDESNDSSYSDDSEIFDDSEDFDRPEDFDDFDDSERE